MIYLDYQATTPLAPEARDAMLPWLGGPGTLGFANPHSPHRAGRAAAAAVEVAREQVALGGDRDLVVDEPDAAAALPLVRDPHEAEPAGRGHASGCAETS